jgi:uncharacterized protein (DUF1778 family)
MPRHAIETNKRLALRIDPEAKAIIMRAASLAHTDVTAFILQSTLPAARTIIEQAERLQLSERDSLRVLELLEHPPLPNNRLRSAASELPPLG